MDQCNYKTKIIRDDKKKEFSIGGIVFTRPLLCKSAAEMMAMVDKNFNGNPNKEKFKAFGDKYGISAAKMKTIHNAIITQQWIDPVRDLSKYFAFGGNRGTLDPRQLERVHKFEKELRQAEKDGIKNITPLIFYTGMTPATLKKSLGKSLWKTLCKNSFTRNLHIGKYHYKKTRTYFTPEGLKVGLGILNSFPSSYLKRGDNSPISFTEAGLWVLKGCDKGYYRSDDRYYGGNSLETIYTDTKRMASQVGKTFNPKWDVSTMQKKHEEFTNLIKLRKYSPIPFDSMEDIPVRTYSSGEYTATLLDNALAIGEEGEEMHHCVGSYSGDCAEGTYVVYSITKEGKKSSTLGIFRDNAGYTFSQHYKACNKRVIDSEEKQIALDIIAELNKQKMGVFSVQKKSVITMNGMR